MGRLFSRLGGAESDGDLRHELHLEAERLFEAKQSMDPRVLFAQTEALKARMQQFNPWDGCTRFFCPLTPYFSYHEITERIREANTIARARGGNPTGSITAQRGREIVAGVGRGEQQAERLRGSGSVAEQAAAAAVFGVPGLLFTSAGAREVTRNVPGAVVERAEELAEGNLCTTEQVAIPLLGKLTCPGGVGCGWGCMYEKHKALILILTAVAGLGIAAVVLSPYAKIAQKIF